MKTTYYLIVATGTVVRATTARAQEKLGRLADVHSKSIKRLPPKEAKQMIIAAGEYWKIKDLL